MRHVAKWLSGVGTRVGREVNPYVIGPGEFAKRLTRRDHFLTAVLAEPRLFVIGTEDELAAVG